MINNVMRWLDNATSKHPNKVAFRDETNVVSFLGLRKKAMLLALKIIEKNLFKQPIVVFMDGDIEEIAAFLGVAYSGCFYSPIDAEMPVNRIAKIIDILEPKCILTTRSNYKTIEKIYKFEYIIFCEDILCKEIDEDEEQRVYEIEQNVIDTDLLYVLFTSGSTGVPKGVAINHRSVCDYIEWLTNRFGFDEDTVFGNQAPFYFDNSILDIYATIYSGATCNIIPKKLFSQPVRLLEYIGENDINTIFWVPSALIVVSRANALKNVDLNGKLKKVLFCGEVMPNKQLNIWRKYLPKAMYANLYGPTEITDVCTYYIVNRDFSDEDPLPIGKPTENTDIIVLNNNDEIVSGDEPGELCVRGTCLSSGYYNNPEKTKDVFVQNPLNRSLPEIIYRTGDIVRYNEYGELIFLARKDFQVKHMGHRIELGEIETAVSSIDEIGMCCCLYDEKKNKICLFIDQDMTKQEINEKLSINLPQYMLPNKVYYVENFPMNLNGKIDRTKLKDCLGG